MGENESRQGKDLAKDLSFENKVKEAIKTAILQDKDTITLTDGRTIINLQVIREKQQDNIYNIRVGNKNLVVATRDRNGNINFSDFKLDLEKFKKLFNTNKMQIMMSNEQREKARVEKEVEKGTPAEKTTNNKNMQQNAVNRVMEQKIKTGLAQEMEIYREFSDTETMRMFIRRAFGVQAKNVYRVKGKGTNDFKYVAENSDGYQDINLSSQNEGKNPTQKILLIEDGQIKKKDVNSLLTRGSYAIATEVPNSALSDNTRTYLTRRTPEGDYIGIAVAQKQGVNRNISGDKIQKDMMSRANSIYELDDIVEAAKLASKIFDLTKDGKLTTKEVEMVRRLRTDNGLSDKAIGNVIDGVVGLKKMGLTCDQIKEVAEKVKIEDEDFATITTLLNDMGYEFNSPEEVIQVLSEIKSNEKEMLKKAEEYGEQGDSEKSIHDGHDGERQFGPKHW